MFVLLPNLLRLEETDLYLSNQEHFSSLLGNLVILKLKLPDAQSDLNYRVAAVVILQVVKFKNSYSCKFSGIYQWKTT